MVSTMTSAGAIRWFKELIRRHYLVQFLLALLGGASRNLERELHRLSVSIAFMILKSCKRVLADIRGFSIGELMTVVSLIGILAAVGIPSFLSFQPSMRLNGAAREVLSRLMWARANAVQNNNTSVVTFLNDHSFQIFNDANGNGSVDANETTTVDLQTDYSDVTFTVTGSSSTPTFTGRGTAASDTTVTISNPSGSKTVEVSATGNVKIN
jgi:type IV fimbrial biogenesis protein FimT